MTTSTSVSTRFKTVCTAAGNDMVMGGPRRRGVNLYIDQLIDISHMKHAKLQHRAINAMRHIGARSATPALMHHLMHSGGAAMSSTVRT